MAYRARLAFAVSATCAILLLGTLIAHGGEPRAAYQPDWAKLATHVVERSLKLAPGERVIIHHDPARDPGMVAALRVEIVRHGGIISGELSWADETIGKYLESLSPEERRKRGEAEIATYRPLFASSDVYLWLHAPDYEDLVPREFEHLISESKVRSIHSHWFESPEPAERDTVRRMYERAIEVDPGELQGVLAPMEAKLRGAKVRLTSPAGTDLTFRIPADAWFHLNTGEASREKVANARSTRDREEELPGGVLRTTAVEGASGKLFARLPWGEPTVAVIATFREGRITKLEARNEAGADLVKWYESVTGDRDRISELVIGVNPYLTPIQPSGFMPYYGYGAGVIRIAIGENWESGGTLRTSDAADQWLFVTDGTLTANGVTIVQQGALKNR